MPYIAQPQRDMICRDGLMEALAASVSSHPDGVPVGMFEAVSAITMVASNPGTTLSPSVAGDIIPMAFLVGRRCVEAEPDGDRWVGPANYAITRLIRLVYPSPRYRDINEIMGVLRTVTMNLRDGTDFSALGLLACVEHEFYRVLAAPYEDLKSAENGPV